MKRMILVFVLFAVTANASYLRTKHYYDAGQYAKAVKEAKASYAEYKDYRLHLLWARSAQKLGHTTEAMAAYERVLILDERNEEAKHALKAIYTKTGRRELSVDGMGKSRNSVSVADMLRGKADLSIGHDTNINIHSSGTDLDAYYGAKGNRNGLATTFLKFEGEASYLHTFSKQHRWHTKGVLSILAQNNLDAHKYNLYALSGAMGLIYDGENSSFYIPVIVNRIYYLERDFLVQSKIMPRVTFDGPLNTRIELGADYIYKSYIAQEDKNMNSEELAGSIGLYMSLGDSLTYVGAGYHKRTPDSTTPERFVSADFWTFDINTKYRFNDTFSGELYYKYKQGNYKDDIGSPDIHSSVTREDHLRRWGAKLTYVKDNKIKVYLRDEYSDNSSNYMPAEYDKNTVSMGVNLSF